VAPFLTAIDNLVLKTITDDTTGRLWSRPGGPDMARSRRSWGLSDRFVECPLRRQLDKYV
jgi:hypothetical protein